MAFLKVPAPPMSWTVAYQVQVNQALEVNDLSNRKKDTDIEVGRGARFILSSPNGSRYAISVNDAGVIRSDPA